MGSDSMTGPQSASLHSLSQPLLGRVLGGLDWEDLLAAGQASAALRRAAAPAWPGLCAARWQGPLNSYLYPREGRPWKTLFLGGNGWWAPREGLACRQRLGRPLAVAVAPSAAAGATLVATADQGSRRLDILQLADDRDAPWEPRWQGGDGPGQAASVALVAGDAGLLAAGLLGGEVQVFQLQPSGGTTGGAEPRATLRGETPPTYGASATQLIHLEATQQLLALHDPAVRGTPAAQGAPASASVSALDLPTLLPVAPPARDLLEGYHLCCMAAAEHHGPVLVAGSVRLSEDQERFGFCRRCPEDVPPSLCFHRPPASQAALCCFDLRAPRGLANRYALPNRSLVPQLQLVRGQFLCTSHAGEALAVWDLRRMGGGPAWSQPRLPALQEGFTPRAPLARPAQRPQSQGVRLATNGDWLAGASDNGMLWLWDLSECLGWADGRHPGAWVRDPEPASHWDETDAEPWPRGLGSIAGAAAAGGGEGSEAAWAPRPVALGMTPNSLVASLPAVPSEPEGSGIEGWQAGPRPRLPVLTVLALGSAGSGQL